jgi:uncharacterized protein YegJ (DUF2314 family)
LVIGIILRRILGAIALVFGVSILAWFVYNQFYPTAEFQRSYLGVFQLVVPIAFLIYGWRSLHYDGVGIEETPGTFTSPELVESVAHAKASLPYFLDQVEKNPDGAYIKFPMTTAQGMTEHIWAYVHSYRDGKFNVSLANKPKDPKESAQGRRDVPIEEVEAWQVLQPDGQIKGAFSTIALFRNRLNSGKQLTPRMRKQKAVLLDFPNNLS